MLALCSCEPDRRSHSSSSDGGPFVNSLIKRAVTMVVPSPVVIGSSPWSASMCGKREPIEIKHMEISID